VPILVTCECGKQFQAKDENVGRKFLCTECGREVMVPKPDSAFDDDATPFQAVPTRTSGKAITSLVLGILSVLGCFFLTGLPALIFGAFGLSTINSSKGRIGGKGLAIAGIVTGAIGSILMVPVLLALLLPAVQAARRAQCVNNLKQIALALQNYESSYGRFPGAAIVDKDGKPLLSWRVAILPYIEQSDLYDQFKLDEPWDSPSNKPLIARMPRTFQCPSESDANGSTTHYQAITGAGTLCPGPEGLAVKDITDGTSNTIQVIEALTPVDWTKPDDVDAAAIGTELGSKHPFGANVLLADGAVRFVRKTINPLVLKAMTTASGGEVISADAY
jgi:prepilin-type processing-associated H-X9-DG protein